MNETLFLPPTFAFIKIIIMAYYLALGSALSSLSQLAHSHDLIQQQPNKRWINSNSSGGSRKQ